MKSKIFIGFFTLCLAASVHGLTGTAQQLSLDPATGKITNFKPCVSVSHADGSITYYQPTANTDVARAAKLSAAATAAVASDVINIGSGTFDLGGGQVIIPASVTVDGTGSESTIIQSTRALASGAILAVTSNNVISNLQVKGTAGSGVFQAPIGKSGTLSNATLINVKTVGGSDGVYLNGSGGGEMRAYNCIFTAKYDTTNIYPGFVFEAYNCQSIVTGPFTTPPSTARGLAVTGGILRWYNGRIDVTGGSDRNTGVTVASTAAAGGIEIYGARLHNGGGAATANYDFENAGTGTFLKVSGVRRDDGLFPTTFGTVTQLSFPVSGSITTADALADNTFASTATTQKALTVQARPSQTANIMEVQNSAGVPWFAVSPGSVGTTKSVTSDTGTGTGYAAALGHQTTATPAPGLGVGQIYNLDDSTTANQQAGSTRAVWISPTHGATTSDFIIHTQQGSVQGLLKESARFTSGGMVKATTFRATPSARPSPTPQEGQIYEDSTDHHFYGYDGSQFRQLDNSGFQAVGFHVTTNDLKTLTGADGSYPLTTLPGSALLIYWTIKPAQSLAAPSLSAATTYLESDVGAWSTPFDVKQAMGADVFLKTATTGAIASYPHLFADDTDWMTPNNIALHATTTGANLSALTAGGVDVWIVYATFPTLPIAPPTAPEDPLPGEIADAP